MGELLFDGGEFEDLVDTEGAWSGSASTYQRPAFKRWEQAFSVDGGDTCVTNWIMEFSRPSAA
ncbi:hypothetical protein [Streptomyces colonosanans]|uniref:Uncharacterized protein n=1 Tax=Streptomyces colonosanans TaxID=1428652 RepID=A0A1S2P3U8_9ACTN|nr:hypothetical protein BIV24_22425 [Streptomyces colonosanans]